MHAYGRRKKLLLMLLLLYIVDVNVNIFEKMFNINGNYTDYMYKKCCETNYSLCRDI